MAKKDTAANHRARVEITLRSLSAMSIPDLRAEWRRLYRAEPPKKVRRDLLELAVAWKLQEKVFGGLSGAQKRRLTELSQTMAAKGDLAQTRLLRLKPGARLVREWRGASHEVLVVGEGFTWGGRTWPSLTAIARQITGTHWSGPRFFGLAAKGDAVRDSAEEIASG